MKKLITILLTIFLTSGIYSCRSVKKNKSSLTEIVKSEETKIGTETAKEDINVKKTEETKIDSKTQTVTKTTTTKPIDPTKPATTTDSKGNKKTLENAELIEEETTTNNNTLIDIKANQELERKLLLEKQLKERKEVLAKLEAEKLNLERSFPIKWILISVGIVALGLFAWYKRLSIVKWFKNIWWV